jgi:hypothetical protein
MDTGWRLRKNVLRQASVERSCTVRTIPRLPSLHRLAIGLEKIIRIEHLRGEPSESQSHSPMMIEMELGLHLLSHERLSKGLSQG